MFGIDDKKFSDLEVAQAYWDRMKIRMEWCRNAAKEYLNNNPRRKFYKLRYDVDSGEQTTYASIRDGDVKILKKAIEQEIAENGPFNSAEDRYDFFHDAINELEGIDWEEYIPERDQHWAGGPAIVTDVDLDDFINCCKFKVKRTEYFRDDKEALYDCYHNIKISDDEYVDILTAKLFDKNLTFYDLKYLYKDLFDMVSDICHRPHEHHIIFMDEINGTAKTIIESTPKEELPPPVGDNMFMGFILRTIYENVGKFDDPRLMEAIKLAHYQSLD